MRPVAFALLLVLLWRQVEAADAGDVSDAADVAARFQSELRDKLMAAMAAGGPAHAVTVCKDEAPMIAERLSAQSGWSIKRVGTRVRNSATGTPDEWERTQLAHFAEALQRGDSPATLHTLETVTLGGTPIQRYAQPILTGAPCLACHGEPASQPDTLRNALQTHYPQDAATGYRENELRGAFSLRRPLRN